MCPSDAEHGPVRALVERAIEQANKITDTEAMLDVLDVLEPLRADADALDAARTWEPLILLDNRGLTHRTRIELNGTGMIAILSTGALLDFPWPDGYEYAILRRKRKAGVAIPEEPVPEP